MAAVRAAGIAGVVLALAAAAVPAAGDAAVPPAAAARSAHAAARAAAWAVQPTPNPLVRDGRMAAVSCTSPSACIAVGSRINSAGVQVTLAETWNGTSWSVQQTPSPPGAGAGELLGVSCTSPSRCTATGNYANSAAKTLTLAEVWNGTSWSRRKTPDPPSGGSLGGVSCTSASACTAVGSDSAALAEAWDGTSWSVQPITTPPGTISSKLTGVSCTSASVCVAVGNYPVGADGDSAPLAEEWNGTSWSILPAPANPGAPTSSGGGTFLTGVSCISPSACTVVGYFINSSDGASTLAESWNGTTWTVQPAPGQPGDVENVLLGVSCTSATACTAVGYYRNQDTYPRRFTLAESWNGTSWSIQPTPGPETTTTAASAGVSCPTAIACTAVWSTGHRTIAAGWNGTSWALQHTASPAGSTVHLLGSVSCPPAGGCTAVGDYQATTGGFNLAEATP